MGIGLDNWEQVAEMRAACRELTFGDEQGRENEVWLDYNADLVSRGSDVCASSVHFCVVAVAVYLTMCCRPNASVGLGRRATAQARTEQGETGRSNASYGEQHNCSPLSIFVVYACSVD